MNLETNIREIQKGILQWYPFREGAKCLYIGEETDAVYEMLTDPENDRIRGLFVRCVKPEELSDFTLQEEYDYIISIASLEKLENIADALCVLAERLAPKGHMLLGFNNRFGARYFFGDQDPYTGNIMDGIEDYRRAYSKSEDRFVGRCYDKASLVSMLTAAGLKQQNYSVFPDLSNMQVLIREDYKSNEDFSIRILPTFNNPSTVFLEEEYVYNSLQRNDMLHAMANAYVFDCTRLEAEVDTSDILQVTSSMGRDREDAFFTMIRKRESSSHADEKRGEEETVIVEKLPAYAEGEKRIEKMLEIAEHLRSRGVPVIDMELQEKSLVMPYIDAPTAQAYLTKLLEEDENHFLEKMDEFIALVKMAGADFEGGESGEMPGYPDLVPLNCFYEHGHFLFFDQEFETTEYPPELAVYRAIYAMRTVIEKCDGAVTLPMLYQRYLGTEDVAKWQDLEWEFISKLRNEKAMAPYFSKVRHDFGKVYSNRQRMNFSAEEYMERFVNIFKGLEDKKVVVFGSGQFAKQFMQMYGGDYEVAAVVDNRVDVQGEDFYGVKISSPEILKQLESGSYRVIICIKNFLSVKKQLEDMGVSDFGIFDPAQRYMRERFRRGGEMSGNVTDPNNVTEAGNGDIASAKIGDGAVESSNKSAPRKYHIGYIAGVFDLFHVGHLEKFKMAKELCDYLIVGLVTDEGVVRYKKTTPFVPFEERKAMLEACRYVDEVVKIPPNFGGTREAWKMYGFDVQFSGSDYEDDPRWIADKEFLEEHGSTMVFFPYSEATSSSKLKELINRKLL